MSRTSLKVLGSLQTVLRLCLGLTKFASTFEGFVEALTTKPRVLLLRETSRVHMRHRQLNFLPTASHWSCLTATSPLYTNHLTCHHSAVAICSFSCWGVCTRYRPETAYVLTNPRKKLSQAYKNSLCNSHVNSFFADDSRFC